MLLVREKRKQRKHMIKVFSALCIVCVFREPLFFVFYQRRWSLNFFKHPVFVLQANLLLSKIVPDRVAVGLTA